MYYPIVRIPKKLIFKEPVRMHAPSKYSDDADKKTIYDLAVELEDRYNIIHKFIVAYKSETEEIIRKELLLSFFHKKSQEEFESAVIDNIRTLWRTFILNAEHGMTTKASESRGDPAFVDTSDYYLSLEPGFIYD